MGDTYLYIITMVAATHISDLQLYLRLRRRKLDILTTMSSQEPGSASSVADMEMLKCIQRRFDAKWSESKRGEGRGEMPFGTAFNRFLGMVGISKYPIT